MNHCSRQWNASTINGLQLQSVSEPHNARKLNFAWGPGICNHHWSFMLFDSFLPLMMLLVTYCHVKSDCELNADNIPVNAVAIVVPFLIQQVIKNKTKAICISAQSQHSEQEVATYNLLLLMGACKPVFGEPLNLSFKNYILTML